MAEKLQAIRGMKDLLPEDFAHQKEIIDIARKIGETFGFKEVSTPILEYNSVFARTLGDTSEVVSKEMYNFEDRSGDSVTLRPEFTASIVRAFISNGLTHLLPLRYFSSGPVFRYDRPQAGRQRQFHQLNFEYLGADGFYTDYEILKLSSEVLDKLGVLKDSVLELNSLGSGTSRTDYAKALQEYFSKYESDLSDDSKIRLEKNPLRILDSKDENDQKLVKDAPIISEFYSDEDKTYFNNLLELLDIQGVNYKVSPRLVRGLDYYSHTAFEFTTTKLGAQATILGGGRYDGLSKIMGGPDLPAIGFAAGIERIALVRSEYKANLTRPISIIPIGEENLAPASLLASKLREEGKSVLVQHKGKIAKRMQNANKANSLYAIMVGEDEVKSKSYKVKNMDEGTEATISEEELVKL